MFGDENDDKPYLQISSKVDTDKSYDIEELSKLSFVRDEFGFAKLKQFLKTDM